LLKINISITKPVNIYLQVYAWDENVCSVGCPDQSGKLDWCDYCTATIRNVSQDYNFGSVLVTPSEPFFIVATLQKGYEFWPKSLG
jgi:hypothetical protein